VVVFKKVFKIHFHENLAPSSLTAEKNDKTFHVLGFKVGGNLVNSRLAPEISGGAPTPTFLREPLGSYG